MLFNVRPWLRQWHNVWLSKPFGLDIAELKQLIFQTSNVRNQLWNRTFLQQGPRRCGQYICLIKLVHEIKNPLSHRADTAQSTITFFDVTSQSE